MAIFKPNKLGQEILETKYLYPGEKTWAERAKVVSNFIASAEKDEDKAKVAEKFYKAISSGDFVPGGRILFGAGRNSGKYNLLNCFFLLPQDSVDSIGKLISNVYKISCSGGGVGLNFSLIRPLGDSIQNIDFSAPGAVSVMKMINEVGNHVRSGKNRRLALLAMLDVTHPDILLFLKAKLDLNELTNFNISIASNDRFIKAVEDDEDWHFTFNNRSYFVYEVSNGKETIELTAVSESDAIGRANNHYKEFGKDYYNSAVKVVYKARDLWDTVWKNAVKTGEPGFLNLSLAKHYTNVSYFEDLVGYNPCTEINIPDLGNCTLGSVNLSNMVFEDNYGNPVMDWKRLAAAIRAGVRFLDNTITSNHFPIPGCEEVAHRSRRIGLGVMGYHYMLIKLGIRYGSEKCLEFTELLMKTFRDTAYLTSVHLAKDKGSFTAFDSKKYLKEGFAKKLPHRIRHLIKKHGIRNAVMLTAAPTGSTSMVMGVSSGIEPIFAPMYLRRYREANSWKETPVIDPLLQEYLEKGKDTKYFCGAYDVTPEEHMAVQSAFQEYIDNSISKTINVPEDFSWEQISDLALHFAPNLKGFTIYRENSRGMEPLKAIELTPENLEKYGSSAKVEMDKGFCKLGDNSCGDV